MRGRTKPEDNQGGKERGRGKEGEGGGRNAGKIGDEAEDEKGE